MGEMKGAGGTVVVADAEGSIVFDVDVEGGSGG